MPFYNYYFDKTYLLVIAGAILCILASLRVRASFARYSRVGNHRGIRAEEVAEMILRDAGIFDVRIERVRGRLTDHYHPGKKVLRLSDSVFGSTSVAAIGVAAHECGHAIQHHRHYIPVLLRTAIVPVVNIGSSLSWPVILLGLILSHQNLLYIGIGLFALVVLFQLVTLPVEFDASGRALKILKDRDILNHKELKGARRVLKAAAMTYVTSLVSSLLQLLRLILLFGRRNS